MGQIFSWRTERGLLWGLKSIAFLDPNAPYTILKHVATPKETPLSDISLPFSRSVFKIRNRVRALEISTNQKSRKKVSIVYFGGIGQDLEKGQQACLLYAEALKKLNVDAKVYTLDHMRDYGFQEVIEDGFELCKYASQFGKLIIISHSLGSGFAPRVAVAIEFYNKIFLRIKLEKLILCSPFKSVASYEKTSPALIRLLFGADGLNNEDVVPYISTHTVFISAGQDSIPCSDSIDLCELRKEYDKRSTLLFLRKGTHDSTWRLPIESKWMNYMLSNKSSKDENVVISHY
jgi:hypothetical protein